MTESRDIPEAAIRDRDSIELLRVWIAEQGLHCSMKVGMYQERGITETTAWGIALSDVIRHIARALHLKYGEDPNQLIAEIKKQLLKELGTPSSAISGKFL